MTEELVKVTSKDGTSIAAGKSGTGPPLVLVHGATADRTRWRTVLPSLERHFTCYAMDRRGRGASGDGPRYALEREYEDVAALCASIPGEVALLGHSYGGLCALGAAPTVRNLRRLILYEPAAPPPEHHATLYPPGAIDGIQAKLDAGDREGALVSMMRDVARIPEKDIAVLRSLPAWRGRLAAAHTMPRELRADEAWRLDPALCARIRVPTLLLLGGASPPEYRAGEEALRAALPDARIAVMPGQGHAAMDTGTQLFVDEVRRFLAG